MKYFCNPLNVPYRYQFNASPNGGPVQIAREGADPSLICFKGRYYLFPSMNLSVWVSDDLAHWEAHRLPDNLPLYDYAPDVRVFGDYVYFCASKRLHPCNFYRTKDVLNGPYEEIPGTFDFWDPDMFRDDDGRVYFYWGCDSITPIWGVELDPETMRPLGERTVLIEGHPFERGYERSGVDNSLMPLSEEEVDRRLAAMLKARGMTLDQVPAALRISARGYVSQRPYIEGAWMTKHDGRYYLQYACSGSQYNGYADGVYVSDKPLGPFEPALDNPYSYKPGGFIPGAGHGSTLEDAEGHFWHTATMRISVNHQFERRVGLWPAGFDADGTLFCNQRYGDWPQSVEKLRADPWSDPDWMLLSFGKTMTASSAAEGHGPALAADEDVQTWWRAADAAPGQWIQMDLGKVQDVRAVQINFADDHLDVPTPGKMHTDIGVPRYIDEGEHHTRWTLEISRDGEDWTVLADKRQADTDLPHDLVVCEEGTPLRFLRLTVWELPFGQPACVSGLRVFGHGGGQAPKAPACTAVRENALDMTVTVQPAAETGAVGYNILWGRTPEKLYHSWMVFGRGDEEVRRHIGALVKEQDVFVRVDAFNEAGITAGTVMQVQKL